MNLKPTRVIHLHLDRVEYLWNKTHSYNISLSLVVDCNVKYLCSVTGSVIVGSDYSV